MRRFRSPDPPDDIPVLHPLPQLRHHRFRKVGLVVGLVEKMKWMKAPTPSQDSVSINYSDFGEKKEFGIGRVTGFVLIFTIIEIRVCENHSDSSLIQQVRPRNYCKKSCQYQTFVFDFIKMPSSDM